ncbi:hypothetical protein FALCPG4_015520 [Fusarium falciforme]
MNAALTFQPIQPKEPADAEPGAGITADGLDGSRQEHGEAEGRAKPPRSIGRRSQPKASTSTEVPQPAPTGPGRGSRISEHWTDVASRPAALHAAATGADLEDASFLGRSLLPKGAEEATQSPCRGNAYVTEPAYPESSARQKRQRLRSHRPSKGQPPRKRVRIEVQRQTREVGAEQALASVLRWLEEDFN